MAQIDPKVVSRLLDLLSSDDGFRKRFTESPAEALKEAGATDVSSASCLTVQALASKQQIRATRQRLEAQLTGSMDQQPLNLEAAAHRE